MARYSQATHRRPTGFLVEVFFFSGLFQQFFLTKGTPLHLRRTGARNGNIKENVQDKEHKEGVIEWVDELNNERKQGRQGRFGLCWVLSSLWAGIGHADGLKVGVNDMAKKMELVRSCKIKIKYSCGANTVRMAWHRPKLKWKRNGCIKTKTLTENELRNPFRPRVSSLLGVVPFASGVPWMFNVFPDNVRVSRVG